MKKIILISASIFLIGYASPVAAGQYTVHSIEKQKDIVVRLCDAGMNALRASVGDKNVSSIDHDALSFSIIVLMDNNRYKKFFSARGKTLVQSTSGPNVEYNCTTREWIKVSKKVTEAFKF